MDTKNLSEIKKEMILKVIRENSGNKTNSANKLGISIRTLRCKIKKYRKDGAFIPED